MTMCNFKFDLKRLFKGILYAILRKVRVGNYAVTGDMVIIGQKNNLYYIFITNIYIIYFI